MTSNAASNEKKSEYKILVVDDEPQILKLISNYLELEGFQVKVTESAREAMKLIESKDYRIVISDILMPEMSGIDLLRKIKEFDGLIQVVMITAYVDMGKILAAFRHGANNCLFKPFENLGVLRAEIDTAAAKLDRVMAVLREREGYR
jgi:CheY-like chemotaxis protein